MPIPNRVLKLHIVISGIATMAPSAINTIAKNAKGPTLYDVIFVLHCSDLGQLLLYGLVLAFSSRGGALLVHSPNVFFTIAPAGP
jgi:hypothetical protein